jgi:hypothetical protein
MKLVTEQRKRNPGGGEGGGGRGEVGGEPKRGKGREGCTVHDAEEGSGESKR